MPKPTGIDGFVKVGLDANGRPSVEYKQVTLPAAKGDVELLVANGFVRSIAQTPGPGGEPLRMSNLSKNEEDDFDFTVTLPDGPAYLELMEAAPLEGPYKAAPARYKVADFAAKVHEQILRKASRYPRSGVKRIYLLIYVTHWAFGFVEATKNCLRYWLARTPSPFSGVFLYEPYDTDVGAADWLLPGEVPQGFDPTQVIEHMVLQGNPQTAQRTEDGKLILKISP